MKIPISIDIAGCVDNVHVNVRGEGWLDPEDGEIEIELEADRAAAHWDLALLPVLGLDPMLAMAAGIVPVPADGDVPAPFRTRANLFDENDREMGEMVLSGEIRGDKGGIEVAGQLLRCETRFEMGEIIASVAVPALMAVLPAGESRIVTARGLDFSTRRGNRYWSGGTSWIRGRDCATDESRTIRFDSVDVDRVFGSKSAVCSCDLTRHS